MRIGHGIKLSWISAFARPCIFLSRAGLTLILSFWSVNLYAQESGTTFGSTACSDSNSCLNSIVQNTYFALQKVNALPTALRNLSLMALSLNTHDNGQTTSQLQNYFAKYGNSVLTTIDAQMKLQPNLNIDLFANGDKTQFQPTQSPKILKTIPYLNDLAYSTLLGQPPAPQASGVAQSPYNYIKNIGGVTIQHAVPEMSWSGGGDPSKVTRYVSYYNTTMAIQSFNSYVMSRLYVENQKQNLSDTMQQNLMNQATTSTWFTEIGAEELGKVLRQLLMFQSQSYVLLNQLVRLQKELLSAQIMTNSLLILNNQANEDVLVAKAQGIRPTG